MALAGSSTPGFNRPAGSSACLIARMTSEVGRAARGGQPPDLGPADAVLRDDRAAKLRRQTEHRVVHGWVPGVGPDDVHVQAAVAEVAPRTVCAPGAAKAMRRRTAGSNLARAPSGTLTSSLCATPSAATASVCRSR